MRLPRPFIQEQILHGLSSDPGFRQNIMQNIHSAKIIFRGGGGKEYYAFTATGLGFC
jgi:hypothetical protein